MTDASTRKPLQGHFDAKKHAYRQTQDGVVISFVVDPADISAEFAVAPLGTPLKIAFAEFDPETGEEKAAPKEKRRFEDMKPSQQAALLCKDPEFHAWLDTQWPVPWRGYAESVEEAAAETLRRWLRIRSRTMLNDGDPRHSWVDKLKRFRAFQTENRHRKTLERNTPAMERGK